MHRANVAFGFLQAVRGRFGRRISRNIVLLFVILTAFFFYYWISSTSKGDDPLEHARAYRRLYGWLASRSLRDYVRPGVNSSLLEPASVCAGPAPLLTVVVTSAPANAAARGAIRRTWGRPVGDGTRTRFLVGRTRSSSVQAQLEAEATRFGDVIQEDFLDDYLNLTIKSVYMLKWLTTRCADAPFALKADDDMWVDMPALLDFLRGCRRPGGACAGGAALVAGRLYRGVPADRRPGSKWYLPPALHRPDRLPDFVSGTAYVVSGAAAAPLYRRALDTPFVNLEDLFVSGLVAPRAGVRLLAVAGFEKSRPLWPHACACRGHLTVHGLAPRVLEQLHRDRNATCAPVWYVVNALMVWVT